MNDSIFCSNCLFNEYSILPFFCLSFSFTDTTIHKPTRRGEWIMFTPLHHYHFLISTEISICNIHIRSLPPALNAEHAINRLLFNDIYPPLGISIWLNVNYSLIVDFMLNVINFSQANGWFQLALPWYYKRND